MGSSEQEERKEEFIQEFKEHFVPQPGFKAVYKIQIEGKNAVYNRAFQHCRQASFNASFE